LLTLEEIKKKVRDRYTEIESPLLQSIQGRKILDLGCKIGTITHTIGKANPQSQVIGVDYFSSHIDIAKALYLDENNIRFMNMNAYELKFEDGFFDCICMLEIVEHLNHPVRALREVNRALCQNGSLIISTNNVYHSRYIIKYLLSLLIPNYHPRRMDHGGCEEWFPHIYCWDLGTLYTLMTQYGFEYERHFFIGNFLFVSTHRMVKIIDRMLGMLLPIFKSIMVLKLRKIREVEEEKTF